MFDANITFMTTFGNCSVQDHFVAISTTNLHRNLKFFKFIFGGPSNRAVVQKITNSKKVFWGTPLATHQVNMLP